MKKGLILIIVMIIVSCSSYNIKKDMYGANELKKAGNVVIVLRLPESSSIGYEEIKNNCNSWMTGFDVKKEIRFADYNKLLSTYNMSESRFYQESAGKNYLKYKSLGVIKNFAAANKDELAAVFSEYDVDTVLFYEVGGTYSKILKAINYNSVITILNQDLDVIYLDHQKQYIGDGDFDMDNMKYEFLDILSNRLIITLTDFGYITKK